MRPLFSIITVTRNAAETLPATMESVAAQSCRLFEHIIKDGNSTDNTIEVANSLADSHTRITSSPDHGIYDAMNKALQMARGDYVIFLNAGDRLHSPDTLQHYADAILDNDYPGIVYGQTVLVDSQGKYLGERHLRAPERLTLKSFAHGMVVCHQAMAVLRRIAPLYNTNYRFSSDFEWCIICLQHSRKNVYLDEVVADYLSEGLTTANHKASLKERFAIMRTYYGTIPTTMRHASFLVRHLKRRLRGKQPNKQ